MRVKKRSTGATVATALEKLSVHVDDVDRTRLLVQVVHVLSAQQEVTSEILLQLCKREVRRVRLGSRSHPPPHGVELPHQLGIAVPSFRRSDLLNPVVPPKATHATEGGNAAFGANPCSGEDEHTVSRGNSQHRGGAQRWDLARVMRLKISKQPICEKISPRIPSPREKRPKITIALFSFRGSIFNASSRVIKFGIMPFTMCLAQLPLWVYSTSDTYRNQRLSISGGRWLSLISPSRLEFQPHLLFRWRAL